MYSLILAAAVKLVEGLFGWGEVDPMITSPPDTGQSENQSWHKGSGAKAACFTQTSN